MKTNFFFILLGALILSACSSTRGLEVKGQKGLQGSYDERFPGPRMARDVR